MAKPRPVERSVNQEGGRDGIGLSDGRHLREGSGRAEAPIAQAGAARFAQAEATTTERRAHDAVLEPELVLVIPVPVDLGVDIVAVQALGAGVEVVAVFPGKVGLGNQVQQCHHGAVQASLRDDVERSSVREDSTACAIQVTRVGVEDHPFLERD